VMILRQVMNTTMKPLNQNKMKQTAVEWLMDEIAEKYNFRFAIYYGQEIQQAKEMEKEQIKNAWLNSLTKGDFNSADEYYNYLYKNSEQ